jgi:hypothetical protein
MPRHPLHELPLWSFEFKSSSRVGVLTRRDIERNLIKNALEDESFKNDLLNNPKPTIDAQFDLQLPDSFQVEVLEETDELVYLILPFNPYQDVPEPELMGALGMNLNDLAGLMLEQQNGTVAGDWQKTVNLIVRAWKDNDFKANLLAEPEQTLAAELGMSLSEGVKIRVLEESPQKVYIVIPFLPDFNMEDVSYELDAVNLPIIIGSDSSNPNNTLALDCTQSFTCPIP